MTGYQWLMLAENALVGIVAAVATVKVMQNDISWMKARLKELREDVKEIWRFIQSEQRP